MPTLAFQLPGGGFAHADVPDDATDAELQHIGNDLASRSQPTPEQPTSSAGGAFARGVTSHAGEGIGGGLGAWGGAEGGAAIGSMIAPGPGTLIGGAIGAGVGALAGGYAGQKAQGAPSDEQAAQLAADQAQHPIAAGGGAMVADLPMLATAPEVGIGGKAGAVLKSSLAGGIFGAGSSGGAVATGQITPGEVPGEIVKSAVTMGPLGFIGEPATLVGRVLGKAPADAATLAVTNSLYDHVTGKKEFDPSTLAGTALQNVPGFVALNLLTAALHGHAPALDAKGEGAKVADDINLSKPETQPEPVSGQPTEGAPSPSVGQGATTDATVPGNGEPPIPVEQGTVPINNGTVHEPIPSSSIPVNNATTEDVRRAAGLPPIEPGKPRTVEAMNADADAVLQNDPQAGAKLIAKLSADPRATPVDFETKILERELHKAYIEHDKAAQAVNAAYGDPAKSATAQAHFDATEQALDHVTALDKRVGTLQSSDFRARQGKSGLMDENGMMPVSKLLQNARAKLGGRPLKEEERRSIVDAHNAEAATRKALNAGADERSNIEYGKALDHAYKTANSAITEDASRIKVGGLSPRLPVTRRTLPEIPNALRPLTGDIRPDAKLPGDVAQHALHGIGLLEKVWGITLPGRLAIKKMMGKDFGKYSPAESAIHLQDRHTVHTAIHEVAHWLDHVMGGRDYASKQAAGAAREVMNRVSESDGMRAARATVSNPKTSEWLRGHLNYLLKPEEQFARAVEHATARKAGLPEPTYDPIIQAFAELTPGETDAIIPHVQAALERFEQRPKEGDSGEGSSSHQVGKPDENLGSDAGDIHARNASGDLGRDEVGVAEEAFSKAPKTEEEEREAKIAALYRAHIEANIRNKLSRTALEDKVFPEVRKLYPDMSDREIRDAFSHYHKVTYPSADKIKAEMAEQRTQAKWLSRLEDLGKGISKRFGLQRRPPSDETRRMMKEAEVLKRKLGIKSGGERSLKTARDAIVSRLKNSIADIERQLSGEPILGKPARVPRDAELDALRKHQSELRAYLLDLTGPSAEGKWNATKERAYQRSADEYRRKSATGELERKQPKRFTPNEKVIAAAEDARAAKEHWETLREDAGIIDKQRLQQLKNSLQSRINKTQRSLMNGDFAKKTPREVKLDQEAKDLQYQLKVLENEKARAVRKVELSNRATGQKIADTLLPWRRAELLSGYHVLAKLSAAALARHVVTPIDEAAGGIIGKLSPSLRAVAKAAPREGGFSYKAEAKAIVDGVTNTARHAKEILRTGITPADAHSGKVDFHDLEHYWGKSVAEFFGHAHVFLKASAKEAEFARSLQKRIEHHLAENNGRPPGQFELTAMQAKSYVNAQRAVFQQKNVVSDAWKGMLASLEHSKLPGGKALAFGARILLPITHVPINFAGEALNRTPLGIIRGAIELRSAIKKGLDNLHPDDADNIMRHLKQGSVGTGLMLLGFLNPAMAGGYYQQGEKRKKDDLHPGDVLVQHSHLFAHNSAAEVITMGATIRRVADHMVKGHPEGVATGMFQSLTGLAANTPYVHTATDIRDVVSGRRDERTKAIGNFTQGLVIPRLSAELAKDTDTVASRRQNSVPDYLKAGIPGLRQSLPVKRAQ